MDGTRREQAIEDENNVNPGEIEKENVAEEVTALCQSIPGFEDCDEQDTNEWLDSDINEQGYQSFDDDKTLSIVTKADGDDALDSSDDDIEDTGPSHADAFDAMNWYKKQSECWINTTFIVEKTERSIRETMYFNNGAKADW